MSISRLTETKKMEISAEYAIIFLVLAVFLSAVITCACIRHHPACARCRGELPECAQQDNNNIGVYGRYNGIAIWLSVIFQFSKSFQF